MEDDLKGRHNHWEYKSVGVSILVLMEDDLKEALILIGYVELHAFQSLF